MVARVSSSTLIGIDAVRIDIETQIISALRRFAIVGLPDGVLREAKDRVRCAIENSGFSFPSGELVVNLSPAGLPKTGSGFDLGIALSVLAAAGYISPRALERILVLGELALDGSIKPVPSVLAAACLTKSLPDYELLIPIESSKELHMFSNLRIRAVSTLAESVLHFSGEREVPLMSCEKAVALQAAQRSEAGFGDVVGQYAAKRAMEIVAAGGHNLLMVGPPGSGKSMLAARLPSILPPLSLEEQIEVSKVYAAHAQVGDFASTRSRSNLISQRPFRAPHHSMSTPGLIGGGPNPAPGEISLAHRGVLFIDEITEVKREALEALRQPLETSRMTISRAKMRVQFPADFVLVAAMNPCPCGRRGSSNGICRCPSAQVTRYLSKLSGPISDRIDLQIWVPPVPVGELHEGAQEDSTHKMRERVQRARKRQYSRLGGARVNARLRPGELKDYCRLDGESFKLLERASTKFQLSARAFSRILKVARTIADLEDFEEIRPEHIAEVLTYRLSLD